MIYYQRLRDIREDHDKNQSEIAKIINTSQEQYSRWERGAWQMPIEHYKTLAKYYNVSIDYLAGLISCPKPLATYTEVKNSFNNNNGSIDFKT